VLAIAEEIQASGFEDVDPYDVSSVCFNHSKLLIDALIRRETWSWRSKYFMTALIYFSLHVKKYKKEIEKKRSLVYCVKISIYIYTHLGSCFTKNERSSSSTFHI
jgi:hypothetical protein